MPDRSYPLLEVLKKKRGSSTDRAQPLEPLKTAGLFAGIGGIEYGLHLAGHTTELLCELDGAPSQYFGLTFRAWSW